jgi:hypothetical protein
MVMDLASPCETLNFCSLMQARASTPEEKQAWFDGLHAAGYALKP